MIQLLEETKDDLVAFRISDHIDKSDYDVMLPMLKEKIKHHGKIKAYVELYDVDSISMKALWEEIRFDFKHASDFTKVAVVGDESWTDMITSVAKPFTTAEVKHFGFNQRQQAWEWINA